ncbi:GH23836 [Drosophila grimshawi]|uniref:GH23836 n=1 Tax=Drosophila grimshawi TaxID=7222 RepID=B4K3S2_DROGR|nr:GH23836 [Drosophila grimshawi]
MKKGFIQVYVDIIKKDKSKSNIGRVYLDGCKLLNSFYKDRYGMFFKRILIASNFPKKCPIQGVSTSP